MNSIPTLSIFRLGILAFWGNNGSEIRRRTVNQSNIGIWLVYITRIMALKLCLHWSPRRLVPIRNTKRDITRLS